jgi:hypothetical protein
MAFEAGWTESVLEINKPQFGIYGIGMALEAGYGAASLAIWRLTTRGCRRAGAMDHRRSEFRLVEEAPANTGPRC